MTQAERSVGRPARISRDDIADAALEIGLRNATLKEIATKLKVDHSSLYRHVKGRSDILFAASNRAIARLDWDRNSGDWRHDLIGAAEAVWTLYTSYPGLAETIRSLDRTPPSAIRAFSQACRRLEAHGFTTVNAALVMDSVMDMTSDSASLWENLKKEAHDGGKPAEKLSASWQAAADAQTKLHVQLMTRVIDGDPKIWWRKKLDLLLLGAGALRAAQD